MNKAVIFSLIIALCWAKVSNLPVAGNWKVTTNNLGISNAIEFALGETYSFSDKTFDDVTSDPYFYEDGGNKLGTDPAYAATEEVVDLFHNVMYQYKVGTNSSSSSSDSSSSSSDSSSSSSDSSSNIWEVSDRRVVVESMNQSYSDSMNDQSDSGSMDQSGSMYKPDSSSSSHGSEFSEGFDVDEAMVEIVRVYRLCSNYAQDQATCEDDSVQNENTIPFGCKYNAEGTTDYEKCVAKECSDFSSSSCPTETGCIVENDVCNEISYSSEDLPELCQTLDSLFRCSFLSPYCSWSDGECVAATQTSTTRRDRRYNAGWTASCTYSGTSLDNLALECECDEGDFVLSYTGSSASVIASVAICVVVVVFSLF
jgi:hypothetical protein